MIETMDDAIGLVLDTLDKHGLTENTIVCFTSDNGGVSSGDAYSSSMLPLRGGKGRQWEGGIREPFYFRFPKLIDANSTCDVPVLGIDFYPTLLDLTDIPIPTEQVIDGRSIVSLLNKEQDSKIAERDLFWHYPHYGNQGGDPSSTIRNGPWKMIHYYEDDHDELYNLDSDPGEMNDVVVDNRTKAAELRRRLDHWLAEVGAKFPIFDPEYDPEKEQVRLHKLEHELMPKLEVEHAKYLDPSWQPNENWWGSQVTID
jgi:arylsulfatase A-like enzyme